jgi:hypothetical protein
MEDYTPGDLGFTTVWMVGGPLDGTAYDDMPVLSDGHPAARVSVPQPADERAALFAVYDRRPNIWLDGRWYYDFVEETADPTPVQPVPFPFGTVVSPPSQSSTYFGDLPAVDDSDEAKKNPHVPAFHPAPRFITEQAWWIASELARRNSRLRILDAWPLDGFYHGLEIGEPGTPQHVFLNRLGSIHVFGTDNSDNGFSWAAALGGESPHEIVKSIETTMRWTTTAADPTAPRSLTYRALSSFLTQRLNDRHRWDAVLPYTANLTNGQLDDEAELLDNFIGARRILDSDADEYPLARFWCLMRGRELLAVLHDSALLLQRASEPIALMPTYRKRRRLLDVVAVIRESLDVD